MKVQRSLLTRTLFILAIVALSLCVICYCSIWGAKRRINRDIRELQKNGEEIIYDLRNGNDSYSDREYHGYFHSDFYDVFSNSYLNRDTTYEKIGSIDELQEEMEFKLALAEVEGCNWSDIECEAGGSAVHWLYRALRLRGFLFWSTLLLWLAYALLRHRETAQVSGPRPASAAEGAFCPGCGKPVAGPSNFCPHCGAALGTVGSRPISSAEHVGNKLDAFFRSAGIVVGMIASKLKQWALLALQALVGLAASFKGEMNRRRGAQPSRPASAPGSMVCPRCGRFYPAGQKFCTACGTPLAKNRQR